ncbi:hypothetical protein V3851_04405 [Paenibacillus sp. M1]|uniref:YtzH-like protein n=1 Tax=Paenibacillus haidiansis TaxID=1574488 RepID=A0ABU7VMS1_9BACL
MKERIYKMLDGYELIVSEEALFVRVAEGRMPITTSEEVEFDRVLALVDHLQQQLTEKDATIDILRQALMATRHTLGSAQIIVNAALREGDKE